MAGIDTQDMQDSHPLSPEEQKLADMATRETLRVLKCGEKNRKRVPESPVAIRLFGDNPEIMTSKDAIMAQLERTLRLEGLGVIGKSTQFTHGMEKGFLPQEVRNIADTRAGFVDGASPEFIVETGQEFFEGLVKGTIPE